MHTGALAELSRRLAGPIPPAAEGLCWMAAASGQWSRTFKTSMLVQIKNFLVASHVIFRKPVIGSCSFGLPVLWGLGSSSKDWEFQRFKLRFGDLASHAGTPPRLHRAHAAEDRLNRCLNTKTLSFKWTEIVADAAEA